MIGKQSDSDRKGYADGRFFSDHPKQLLSDIKVPIRMAGESADPESKFGSAGRRTELSDPKAAFIGQKCCQGGSLSGGRSRTLGSMFLALHEITRRKKCFAKYFQQVAF